MNSLAQSVGQYTLQEGGTVVEPLLRGQLLPAIGDLLSSPALGEEVPSSPLGLRGVSSELEVAPSASATSEKQSTSQNYSDKPELPVLKYDSAPLNPFRLVCTERDLAHSASAGDEGPSSTQSSETETERMLWSGATAPELCDPCNQLDFAPRVTASCEGPSTSKNSDPEVSRMLQAVRQDRDMEDASMMQLVRAPGRLQPTGPLLKESHRYIYSKLFHMAWSGQDQQALSIVRALRRSNKVAIDLKVVSMEVVHTVNNDRDLKMLGSALAFTDRTECENKLILKCRIHRRIAGLHYRNGDVDEARDHLDTALQLTGQISPDIDTVYTLRLKALMLFDEYKETGDEQIRKDSEKLFRQAMEHARLQPEWKRPVTERIKISKALFHLDMIDEYKKRNKSEDAIEQLEIRARETLDDVSEAFLTDGDKAFFYLTSAQLYVNCGERATASEYAQKALEINRRCGFHDRAKRAEELLVKLNSVDSTP